MLVTDYRSIDDTSNVPTEAMTGIVGALPSQIGSECLYDVPSGVVHGPQAKGSIRFENHKFHDVSDYNAAAGGRPQVDKAPRDEELAGEEAMYKAYQMVDA